LLDKITILHVEDSILVKDYIKNFLEDKVNNIIFASNGKEGLEIYLKIKPDIVITDINMPIYDELKMSKEIKRLNKDQHIILITGYDNDKILKEAIN
jgi:YesN/AraC family two-component response regulator